MKKNYTAFILIMLLTSEFSLTQNVSIPDQNFKSKLISLGVDTNNDGEISYSEAAALSGLSNHLTIWDCGIADLTGIKAFINIKYLYAGNNELSVLDLSGMTNLKYAYCKNNNITEYNIQYMHLSQLELDFNNLTYIHSLQNVTWRLSCENNSIQEIDFSGSHEDIRLECANNLLTEINLHNIPIDILDCSGNQISSINLEGSTLTRLDCANNLLTEINLHNIPIDFLDCSGNQISSINLEGSTLTRLYCANNLLTEINLHNIPIDFLDCSYNFLDEIIFQGTDITYMNCEGNNLSELNLDGMNLISLNCNNNQLSELNLNGPIKELKCNNNFIESIVVTGAESIEINNNNLRYLDVSECFDLSHLDISYNSDFEQLCVNFIPVTTNILNLGTSEYDVFVCNPPSGDSLLSGQYVNCFQHHNSLNYYVISSQYDLNFDGFPDIDLWRDIQWGSDLEYNTYYVQAINNASGPSHSILSKGFEKWDILVPMTYYMGTAPVRYYYCEFDLFFGYGDCEYYGHYYLLRTISDTDTIYTWFKFNDLDGIFTYNEIRLDEVASWKKYDFPELLGNDTTISIDKTINIEAASGYDTYYWSTRDTTNPINISGDDFGIGLWPVHVYVQDSTYFFTDYLTLEVIDRSCLPDGIEFTTQAQIDSFQINHPNCTEIEGDVEINGGNITNLNGLSVLTSIGGGLYIGDNSALTSLIGLDNVVSIGGGLGIENNVLLTGISELDNLTSINGDLMIVDNTALTTLSGLDSVVSIEGGLGISGNDALTTLTGLDNVTSIGGGLWVEANDALTSLMGLDNIDATSISELNILNNPLLSICEVESVCDYLVAPGGTVEIHDNATGCNSQQEVEEACTESVEEINSKDYLSIFPNPAKHKVSISTDDGKEVDEVTIYTLTGQQVLQKRHVDGTIDISHLQPGMYIVEVTIENTRIRQKLLVQR